jgi:hypothetical protein
MGILLACWPSCRSLSSLWWTGSLGPSEGLIGGALVSAALLLRDWIVPDRKPKILEIGTALLLGRLALYAVLGKATWSVVGVRLCVDAGRF